MKTVVHQSYRTEDVPGWIRRCLRGGRDLSQAKGYDYRFAGDEFFDLLPADDRNIGMLSPMVLRDNEYDGGPALDLLMSEFPP